VTAANSTMAARATEGWRSEARRYKFKGNSRGKFKDNDAQLKLAATQSTATADAKRQSGEILRAA
jgi:hypothetical protein